MEKARALISALTMLCAPLNNDQSPPDELFLERFETFMEKILMEIQAFSEREGRKLDEIRKDVARWHCNHIFQSQSLSSSSENSNRPNEIWNILSSVSRVLESLHHVFGLESFVLAVDPEESPILSYPSEGFLGGTMQGREFWRGLRTGGESGARAFKEHCVKNKAPRKPDAIVHYKQMDTDKSTKGSASVSSKQSAKNVKIDLYDGMRKALRSVSGIRNAEMKWTNHERLFTYGVYLVGWPSDIPVKNPSSLKTDQNKRLLELLNNGTLKFMKNILLASGSGSDQVDSVNEDAPVEEENEAEVSDEMFSWAIQYDVDSTPTQSTTDTSSIQTHTAVEIPRVPDSSRPRKRTKYGEFRGERIRFDSAEDVIK